MGLPSCWSLELDTIHLAIASLRENGEKLTGEPRECMLLTQVCPITGLDHLADLVRTLYRNKIRQAPQRIGVTLAASSVTCIWK